MIFSEGQIVEVDEACTRNLLGRFFTEWLEKYLGPGACKIVRIDVLASPFGDMMRHSQVVWTVPVYVARAFPRPVSGYFLRRAA